MDLITLRATLRLAVGNPSVGDVPNAELDGYLNNAHRDIATKFPNHRSRKRCTFPTEVDEDQYGLPVDVGALLRVRDVTNGRKLSKMGDRAIAEKAAADVLTSGKPLQYTRYRNYIELDRPADAIYTIELFYRETIADMTVDGDEPLVPEDWHPGVWMLAKWYYYSIHEDAGKQSLADKTYKTWLQDKPSVIEEESDDNDSSIEVASLSGGLDPRRDFDHSD